jgi:tetratricopeptide (TPR) repeat protein
MAWSQGDYTGYGAHCASALALYREMGNEGGAAWSLMHLGQMAAEQGDVERARELNEEGLALARQLDEKALVALGLLHLGHLARDQEDHPRAMRLYEESLALYEEVGDAYHRACAHLCLGAVALRQGDSTRSRARLEEALAYFTSVADRQGTAWCLEALAWAWSARGQLECAARIFGSAEMLRETIGRPMSPGERAEHDRWVAATRAGLGDAAFRSAWQEGKEMPSGEAVASAVSTGPTSTARRSPAT